MSLLPSFRRTAPANLGGALLLCALYAFLLNPAFALLSHSVRDENGALAGLAHFSACLAEPGLSAALGHSLLMAAVSTLFTVALAFVPAYASTHSRMPGRRICPVLALAPLCMPSMLPGIGIVYLFGAQGPLKWMLGGHDLYGPLGVVMGSVFFCLPHAALLLRSSLERVDRRLYDAASGLGAGAWRRFFSVTLPGSRYGLVSAALVSFTLTLTDFGVPKVLGGDYSMLATEIYAQVIGQQNFGMGAAVSLVLLLPTALTVTLDCLARRGQARMGAGSGLPLALQPSPVRDLLLAVGAWGVTLSLLAVCGMVIAASFMAFWPYDLSLCLDNYAFDDLGYSWLPFLVSLRLALCVACTGTVVLLTGAWLADRGGMARPLAALYRALLMLPLGLPGTVLGLSYIFAFNSPGTWRGALYGSFFLLVANTVIHFSTVGHMACTAALSRVDRNSENAGRLLGVPAWRTFLRVVLPQCAGPAADLFLYLFINALTTVSAVVFLCSEDLTVASVSVLQMYDSGNLGPAAAMGALVFFAAAAAALIRLALARIFSERRLPHRAFKEKERA